MRKIFLCSLLITIALTASSQPPKENGKIYMTHPYIDVVNNATKAYLANDMKTFATFFADSAWVWTSGLTDPMKLPEAIKLFASDFDYYKDIQLKQQGYPDFLHYVDQDGQFVQSWWTWIGVSKKTGDTLKIPLVQFDNFNKDGKIQGELIYGDFSKMAKDK